MTVLLLGKNEQLGRGLQRTLLPFGNLVAFARDEFDLDKPKAIAARLDAVRPDIIVNASSLYAGRSCRRRMPMRRFASTTRP